MSEGDSFTPSGEDGTRGLVPGYVPPQERTARGGWFRACRLRRGRHEGVSFRATCRLRRGRHEGVRFRATCRLRRGRHEGVSFPGYVPSQERRHEEVLVWGIVSHARSLGITQRRRGAVAVCFEGLLQGHVLAAGAASHACRRRSGSTRGFNFLFCGTGRCCVCLRAVAGAHVLAAGAAGRQCRRGSGCARMFLILTPGRNSRHKRPRPPPDNKH